MVRCFEDDNVVHVDGRVDPVEDANVINYELALADLGTVERRLDKAKRCKWGMPRNWCLPNRLCATCLPGSQRYQGLLFRSIDADY